MKRIFVISVVLMLAACEQAPAPNPQPELDAVPTSIGQPIGEAVTAVIGPTGGTLTSADGTLTLTVPEGALAKDEAMSIQEVTNHAHGKTGKAFRLGPEGMTFAKPITLSFHYRDDDLLGTAPELLSIAYQDDVGFWRTYKPEYVTLDNANKAVSVETNHFSDWSMLEGAQLLPHTAKVKVGQAVDLKVVICERHEDEEDLYVDLVARCERSKVVNFTAKGWAVSGVAGGDSIVGTVQASSDPFAGVATYTAPATKPSSNPVAVSVEVTSPDPKVGKVLLVSHITVEDEAGTWLGTITYTEHGTHTWIPDPPETGSVTFTYRYNQTFRVIGGEPVENSPNHKLVLEAQTEGTWDVSGSTRLERWGACEVNGPVVLRELHEYEIEEHLTGSAKDTLAATLTIQDGNYMLYLDSAGADLTGRSEVVDKVHHYCFGYVDDLSYSRDEEGYAWNKRTFELTGQVDPQNPWSFTGTLPPVEGEAYQVPTIINITWDLAKGP